MAKIIWKANQVISIETRRKDENRKDNIYVLAQMLEEAYLLVFNLFSKDNNWENVNLNEAPILFSTYVAKQFFSKSNVFKQKIDPLTDYSRPKYRIDILGMGYRYVTLWKGTPDEREVLVMGTGGGRLIEGHIGDYQVIMPEISETDHETIDKYELTNVRIYAEFNERLYLCYKFGKNIDPMKDLTFNRSIPVEYKEYIYIMSS